MLEGYDLPDTPATVELVDPLLKRPDLDPSLIRVGRMIKGKRCKYPGYKPVVVLTKSSPYGSLGPYVLKDEHGRIMENVWQFSKVYPFVPKTTQRYSQWDNTVIWDRPAETHLDGETVLDSYWNWREAGMSAQYPIRYPVGRSKHRSACLYAVKSHQRRTFIPQEERLTYVEARRQIYLPEYVRLVKKEAQFSYLRGLLARGTPLLIMEVDGPHQESLPYYQSKYSVASDFIVDSTMIATRSNISTMLLDDKHAFGHGYCLAAALLGMC